MGTRPLGDEDWIDKLETDLIRDADTDEVVLPEMTAVVEAGGGVPEGFELAEAQLIANAENAPWRATQRVLDDAFGAEAEPDRAVYGGPTTGTPPKSTWTDVPAPRPPRLTAFAARPRVGRRTSLTAAAGTARSRTG